MVEVWKPVVGYEGYYEVSDRGRMRSVDRTATDGSRRRGRIRKLVPIGADRQQYLSCLLSRGSKFKCVKAHTEVLRAFVGPPPKGCEARHLDGNTQNNRLSNLRWGTPAENTEDKYRHGAVPCGEQHWRAQLTRRDVALIRQRAAAGERQKDIAATFGVRQPAVSKIVCGLRWTA